MLGDGDPADSKALRDVILYEIKPLLSEYGLTIRPRCKNGQRALAAVRPWIRNIYHAGYACALAIDVTEMGGEQFQNVHELFVRSSFEGCGDNLRGGFHTPMWKKPRN